MAWWCRIHGRVALGNTYEGEDGDRGHGKIDNTDKYCFQRVYESERPIDFGFVGATSMAENRSANEVITALSNQKQKKLLAKLIWQWVEDSTEHRLIAKADTTPGYEDEYIIERLEQDELGEPRWMRVESWRPRTAHSAKGPAELSRVVDRLLAALKSTITRAP